MPAPPRASDDQESDTGSKRRHLTAEEKDKRITELEEEVERLRQREKELLAKQI
jgi:hypothetical protein